MPGAPNETTKRRSRVRGNGEGTIYERTRTGAKGRKGRVWIAEIEYLDAHRVVKRKSAQRKSHAEAVEALQDLRLHARDGARPAIQHADRLVSETVVAYLADDALRVDASTVETYRTIIEGHLLPHLGRRRADSIRRNDVVKWLTTLREKGVGERTTQVAYQRAKAILMPYVAHVPPAENPFPVRGGPKVREPEVRAWSDKQMYAFQAGVEGQPHEAALLLGLLVGLRQGEIRGLRWGDVDLNTGALRIARSLSRATQMIKAPKTVAGTRKVEIPEEGIVALKRHREVQIERGIPVGLHDPVFGTRRGVLSAPALYHGLQREIARLGLPEISFHALRHTFVTVALANGANPKDLQHVLGHADPTLLLRRYGHVIPGAESEVAARISRVLRLNRESGSKSGSQVTRMPQNRKQSATGGEVTRAPSPPSKTTKKRQKQRRKPPRGG